VVSGRIFALVRKIAQNVVRLKQLAGAKLTRFERKELGIIICGNWEAGIEILSFSEPPME
jgi:hypothetical protein